MNPTPAAENPVPQHESYDVLVVGAGPAGTMAARAAASTGARVLLADSAPLPRYKSCGGMLNEYAQRALSAVGELPREAVLEPEWVNFRYYDWDRGIKKPCSLRFRNVDRGMLDRWMLEQLPDSVAVWDHASFVGCTQDDEGVDVALQRQGRPVQVRARWLIGADGARSSVRRAHGGWPQTQCYKTVQEFVSIEPGSVEPYFDCIYSRHVAPEYGYGYIVPKGDVAIVGSVFFPGTKNVPPMHERALQIFGERYPLGKAVRREAGVAIQVRSASRPGPHGRRGGGAHVAELGRGYLVRAQLGNPGGAGRRVRLHGRRARQGVPRNRRLQADPRAPAQEHRL